MTPIKILFICHGNICRSPMAEFVLKKMVDDRDIRDSFLIESAATSREEIGNDIYPPAKKKLREKGIDFHSRAARQVTSEDYKKYDYLIGMDEANIRNLLAKFDEDPDEKIYKLLDFAGIDRVVADPWYTGDFETTYQDVKAGCEGFLEFLGQ
ncbi:MAG: low molecular weight protein-tyrosine-phosphatase [Bacillota bacterium]|nr:low molecular weight protein-tyrosine-phosphatase [Bacillota bacterium]